MREVIGVSVGGGGIQVANGCWELFCLEHKIDLSGHIDRTAYANDPYSYNQAFRSFFSETEEGRFVPRAVHIDLEPSVLDQVREGNLKELFRPQSLISGNEGPASNYTRGYYSSGKSHIDLCMEHMRREAERCDNMQGFLFNSAVGGGTGSGLGSLLLEQMDAEFGKKAVLSFNIFPSKSFSHTEIEPYNEVLAARALMKRSDVCIVMDNEAIYDISKKNLEVQCPTYKNFNQIVAQVASSITASIRFDGALHVDLNEFSTNLIPYPSLNFMLSSYAPIANRLNSHFGCLDANQLCKQVFEPANMMAKCDQRLGKFLACTIAFRGDFIPRDVSLGVYKMKVNRTIRFVDWCPAGFKVGINYQRAQAVPDSSMAELQRSCCMLSNSTAIKSVFVRINQRFDEMYAKKAFIHSYLEEGMEQAELEEAREKLAELEKDYYEMDQQAQAE